MIRIAAGATRIDRPRGRVPGFIWWITGGVLVLLAATYIGAHFMASDSVPRNATVSGVAIGGMDVTAATAKLSSELSSGDTEAFVLTGQPGQAVSVLPADAGLSVDYEATVHRAGAGPSWDPRVLIRVLSGGGPTAPVLAVDKPALAAAIEKLSPEFAREPSDAMLGLDGAEIIYEPMQLGTSLELAKTVAAVKAGYQQAVQRPVGARNESASIPAELLITEPQITDAEVQPVRERLDVVLQPVTVRAPQAEAELTIDQIAEGISFNTDGGTMRMDIDYPRIYDHAAELRDELAVVRGQDARIEIQDDHPVIIPSQEGLGIGETEFGEALATVIERPAPRKIDLDIVDVRARFTTADAEALGIKEVVGEFTTYFPNSSYHNTNLGLAAAGINNELVKPGETFSLSEATGPRNAATGYVPGGAVVGDHIENVVGGGVSQSATTTFNAAFFAGMTDIEHHPHTQYFSQYPPGREATVYEGVLDLKFRNDTPYGVLMQAFIEPSSPAGRGALTVRVWSTQYFDSVTASEPQLFNYTYGRDQISTRSDCVAQSPAQGFDVSYQRIMVLDGKTTTEDFFWRYSPVDRIVCRQPDPPPQPAPQEPAASPEETPAESEETDSDEA